MRHLHDVHSDVDQRAATLEFLAAEDAPVGDAAAAQGLALHDQDGAELAGGGGAFEHLHGRAVAVLEADDEVLLVLAGGGDHGGAFLGVHGQGLLDHDVAAGVQGVKGRLLVQGVGRTDVDGVELLLAEHLAPVEVQAFDVVLRLGLFEVAGVDVGAGDDLDVWHLDQVVQVGKGDAPGAGASP
jgi:hypothetical protein